VIDKPSGWTSHDVVAKSRGILGTRKIGHSGTLDPAATGVLVLGVGRATKLLRYLTGLPKTYEATIVLGVETDTLDADGEVTRTHDMAAPTLEEVAVAAQRMTGQTEQIPPMVSAIKVDGRRLHQLAREGKEVERSPRPITVTTFDVSATPDPMVFDARVDCSSGTYVRVLAADLGSALGGGAHLSKLRRTAVGPFDIMESHPLESPALLAPEAITRVLGELRVDGDTAQDIIHGRVLQRSRLGVRNSDPGPWAVLGPEGHLLAVYEQYRQDSVKPSMVFAAHGQG
jgi:tRNA pseudouridine55 synthase